jgi:hypothetical protein
MATYRVTDPAIGADYGTIQAITGTAALDRVAGKMGWGSYEEFVIAAADHSGIRSLLATEISVLPAHAGVFPPACP